MLRAGKRLRVRSYLSFVMAACFAPVSGAMAADEATATAEQSEPQSLQRIRVEENVEEEAAYRSTRSSTATRTDTPLDEVPQSISVIPAAQIQDQNAQTLQEVLRYTAGVRADMYGLD